jgi:Na+-transporting NADH:ubiquinone oxidoreductase subunit NqrA
MMSKQWIKGHAIFRQTQLLGKKTEARSQVFIKGLMMLPSVCQWKLHVLQEKNKNNSRHLSSMLQDLQFQGLMAA